MVMKIIWLCIISVIFSCGAWFYMSNRHGLFRAKNMACSISMLLFLCIASIVLMRVYSMNTFVHNLKLLTLLALLFPVAFVDGENHIIPNSLILVGIGIRIFYYVIELFTEGKEFFFILKSDLLACLIAVLFLILGVFIIKQGMGMGDIKLLFMVCFFQGITGAVSSIFCSLIIAFLISIGFLVTRKKKRKDTIPFGPSVLIGTYLSILLTGM